MTASDVALAIEWAAGEGWNPGLHDAQVFYAADPGGFLIGELDGDPVASISVVRYGKRFGFLGLYIVKPEYRGRGFGMRLWEAGLAYLAGRNIGLDGVVAQQVNYRASGFKLAYRNVRYEGHGGASGPLDARLVPLSSVPADAVVAYDRALFPDAREAFLRAWIAQPESKAFGVLQHDRLAGYAVVRKCRDGWKIGPLCADTSDIAEALFQGVAAFVPGDAALILDVPEINPAAIALAERHAMRVSFETARMYTMRAPELPLQRLFGVTSFELG